MKSWLSKRSLPKVLYRPCTFMNTGLQLSHQTLTFLMLQLVSDIDGWCTVCTTHHVPRRSGVPFAHMTECPRRNKSGRPTVLPIMYIGTGGTCVGSRWGGHERRGGGLLRKEHRGYAAIGLTNEYRTSQACVWCFEQVRLAKARRKDKDGNLKIIRIHGATECTNPACPSFGCGYTIRGRDTHSAVAIQIAGASLQLSPQRTTIEPFNPRPTLATTRPTNNARPFLERGLPTTSTRMLVELPPGCICKSALIIYYIRTKLLTNLQIPHLNSTR